MTYNEAIALLQSYGLTTTVKSIIHRIDYSEYRFCPECCHAINRVNPDMERDELEKILKNFQDADLDALCFLAEKGSAAIDQLKSINEKAAAVIKEYRGTYEAGIADIVEGILDNKKSQ